MTSEDHKKTIIWVTDFHSAHEAYWGAHSAREEQAAYHEILLFGGKDAWGPKNWRGAVTRWLRQLACWIDNDE